jgi:RNA polymerase sigma factor (TIGR02999 family)
MAQEGSREITGLLRAWGAGDGDALAQLIPQIYNDLRRAARRHIRNERPGNTLESRALVHEAFLRLVGVHRCDWKDRAHFFAVASQMMRRILVDAARARVSEKRGGHLQREKHSDAPDLDRIPDLSSSLDAELVAIHDALDALARIDIRKARVVELRFFGGLSVDESAEVLAVSPQTVMRDWKLAKAWLTREMTRNDPGANRRSSE